MSSALVIRVVDGAEARALLADPDFQARWKALYEQCPWATGYQSPGYVTTWYETYKAIADPVVVVGREGQEHLVGLLTLATMPSRPLVAAGGRQAEYQVWLATAEHAASFPAQALKAVRNRIGTSSFRLEYIPPATPLDWLSTEKELLSEIQDVRRPVMAISAEAIEASWKKKAKKARLGQLLKLGELSFERVDSAERLSADIRDIALMYDLRQAAIGTSRPFSDDPLKADFHVNLMKVPNLIHATVLKVAGSLIGAQLGVRSQNVVHVGVLAHSPFYARYSPGKLQLMFLSRDMAAEGYATLDLTPGGEWKESVATDFDVVRRLFVFGSPAQFRRARYARRAEEIAKSTLSRVGVSPSTARDVVARVRSKGVRGIPGALLGRARAMVGETVELRAYVMSLPASPESSPKNPVVPARRDAVEDLLKFTEAADTPSRADFFRTALSRLEAGHHSYTVVREGRLVHWGWLAEGQQRGMMDEVHQPFTYPPGSVALYDFYTHPDSRGRGLYSSTLRQILADVSAPDHQQAFIFVTAHNLPSRRVIEKLGFAYRLSLFERISRGRSTKWRSDGPVETIEAVQDEPPAETSSS